MQTTQSAERKTYTIAEVRRSFRQIGYGLRTKRNCDFISAYLRSPDGEEVYCGNVFTPESLAKHREALELREQFKGKIFDGDWRVVL